jgi:RHS repeat-associated protein
VTQGGTVIASYTYDALNRRIGFDDNGTQTWTVYVGHGADDHPYADFNSSGSLLNRYVWGPGLTAAVDQILERIPASGTKVWYLNDRLGTVRDISTQNGSGSVSDHVIYDTFGQVTSETNAANGDRFKCAGEEYDGTTGIYYDRARYYDQAIGRFMRQDPMGFGARDANLYRYVGNEPSDKTDPAGLQAPDGTVYPSPQSPPVTYTYSRQYVPPASSSPASDPPLLGGPGPWFQGPYFGDPYPRIRGPEPRPLPPGTFNPFQPQPDPRWSPVGPIRVGPGYPITVRPGPGTRPILRWPFLRHPGIIIGGPLPLPPYFPHISL